jgi:16S rRNA (adenine1518-N6/adenine1519-N6)-dimethyltransferase
MAENYPKVQIVDEKDNVIGAEYLYDAIEKGVIRRASRVFVFDDAGRFLVQKRGANIRKPLLFDQSVGGHVDEGETYLDAATREMKEEIGLEGFELKEIVVSYRNPEFFNAIYRVQVPSGTEVKFDPEEVDSVHWMSSEEVDSLVNDTPDLCTDAFVQIWKEFRDKLVQ